MNFDAVLAGMLKGQSGVSVLVQSNADTLLFEKKLLRYLHGQLWQARGLYGVNNVSIWIRRSKEDYGLGGHPLIGEQVVRLVEEVILRVDKPFGMPSASLILRHVTEGHSGEVNSTAFVVGGDEVWGTYPFSYFLRDILKPKMEYFKGLRLINDSWVS